MYYFCGKSAVNQLKFAFSAHLGSIQFQFIYFLHKQVKILQDTNIVRNPS